MRWTCRSKWCTAINDRWTTEPWDLDENDSGVPKDQWFYSGWKLSEMDEVRPPFYVCFSSLFRCVQTHCYFLFPVPLFRISVGHTSSHLLNEVLPVAGIAAGVWRLCIWNLYNRSYTKRCAKLPSSDGLRYSHDSLFSRYVHKRKSSPRKQYWCLHLRYRRKAAGT